MKTESFVRLAWQCASTFRITDYHGGCNEARIRFSPGKDWETDDGLGDTLALLEPIKDQFGDGLSWSDLIVLAGNVAIAYGGRPSMPFCPRRTDASDGDGWKPIAFGNAKHPKTVNGLIEINSRLGLTNKELVALSWASIPNAKVRTKYLREIVEAETCEGVLACGLKNHPELRVWTEFYVEAGDEVFMRDAAFAWTKMMNADRFDGPVGSACHYSSSENINIPLEALSFKATGSTNSTESISFKLPPIFSSAITIFAVPFVWHLVCTASNKHVCLSQDDQPLCNRSPSKVPLVTTLLWFSSDKRGDFNSRSNIQHYNWSLRE